MERTFLNIPIRTTRMKHLVLAAIITLGCLCVIASIVIFASSGGGNSGSTSLALKTNVQATSPEVLTLLADINTDVEPCNNFYQFVCSEKSKQSVENLYSVLRKINYNNYLKLYNEPIKSNDPTILKIHKNIFQTCTDQKAIIDHFLPTIRNVHMKLGGWPVIIGDKWNAGNFNWMKTIYKIRELGNDYAIFIKMHLLPDAKSSKGSILKISLPYIPHMFFEQDMFMNTIKVFEGEETLALQQMREVYQFEETLGHKIQNMHISYKEMTIQEYQTRVPAVNWLEFINVIGNFNGEISYNDTVSFVSDDIMTEWLELIDKTPKKILANYMLWRVAEEAFPFARQALIHYGIVNVDLSKITEEQEKYCWRELLSGFRPNPMIVAYKEKYLPKEKKQEVIKLLSNIKSSVIDTVINTEWISANDKINILKKVKDVNFVIGMPEEFSNYSLFDTISFDEEQFKSKNFFDVFMRTKKYYLDWQFSWVKKPELIQIDWGRYDNEMKYFIQEDIITIPQVFTQYPFLKLEKESGYLDYTSMGFVLCEMLSRIAGEGFQYHYLSPETKKAYENKKSCMADDIKPLIYHENNKIIAVSDNGRPFVFVFIQKVLNEVYKKYIRPNEDMLSVASNYTTKQLFWISFYNYLCQYEEYNIINTNIELANDFFCKTEKKNECEIF